MCRRLLSMLLERYVRLIIAGRSYADRWDHG